MQEATKIFQPLWHIAQKSREQTILSYLGKISFFRLPLYKDLKQTFVCIWYIILVSRYLILIFIYLITFLCFFSFAMIYLKHCVTNHRNIYTCLRKNSHIFIYNQVVSFQKLPHNAVEKWYSKLLDFGVLNLISFVFILCMRNVLFMLKLSKFSFNAIS